MSLHKTVLFCSCVLIQAAGAKAGVVLTLSPGNGALSGAPGQTVGWGFSLTPDPTDWITVDATVVSVENNPAFGSFQDFLGAQGGPSDGALAPGGSAWTESFDFVDHQGLGAYSIKGTQKPGASDAGTFTVIYETFSANPNLCPNCYVSTSEVSANFSIAGVPEPDTVWLSLCGICLVFVKKIHASGRPAWLTRDCRPCRTPAPPADARRPAGGR